MSQTVDTLDTEIASLTAKVSAITAFLNKLQAGLTAATLAGATSAQLAQLHALADQLAAAMATGPNPAPSPTPPPAFSPPAPALAAAARLP